ncbi:MAG: glycosyltransferase [Polyangiales bacterium]
MTTDPQGATRATGRGTYAVLMPIYDDWESAVVLLERLQAALEGEVARVEYLLVNDGSTLPPPASISLGDKGSWRCDVLSLRRNLGHQRAIAVGLCHLYATRDLDGVVVMDGDGEDTPAGVVTLLRRFAEEGAARTVFAERRRRTESLTFRVFYWLYRVLHRTLTGRGVRVGNFSVVPRAHLDCLVAVAEMWNHYAASVFRARLPVATVPIDRGHRIAGASRMNFTSLLAHGLSAISVFSDVVGMRLLVASGALMLLAALGIAAATAVRLLTDLAIPGWATSVAGILLVVILQAMLLSVAFAFIVLQSRNQHGFLPIRDHAHFIAGERSLGESPGA